LESSEDYLTSEMEKQKRKLKEMSKLMEQQHQLLRLIVQVCWKLRFDIEYLMKLMTYLFSPTENGDKV
jgi:hypothetical protein